MSFAHYNLDQFLCVTQLWLQSQETRLYSLKQPLAFGETVQREAKYNDSQNHSVIV